MKIEVQEETNSNLGIIIESFEGDDIEIDQIDCSETTTQLYSREELIKLRTAIDQILQEGTSKVEKLKSDIELTHKEYSKFDYSRKTIEGLLSHTEIQCPECTKKLTEDELDDSVMIFYEMKLCCNVCDYVANERPKFKIVLEIE